MAKAKREGEGEEEGEGEGAHLYNSDFPFGSGIIRLSFALRSSICPQLSCSRIRYNGSAIDGEESCVSPKRTRDRVRSLQQN